MKAAKARGDLAEAMVPVATKLIVAVRDGGQVAVERVLATVDPDHLHALVVVLAAMVDPDRTVSDLLGWVTFDEHGHSLPPLNHEHQIAKKYDIPLPLTPDPRAWTDRVLRGCHAAHNLNRDLSWVAAGEKEYQRRIKARRRTGT